jgi:hypothetical protein
MEYLSRCPCNLAEEKSTRDGRKALTIIATKDADRSIGHTWYESSHHHHHHHDDDDDDYNVETRILSLYPKHNALLPSPFVVSTRMEAQYLKMTLITSSDIPPSSCNVYYSVLCLIS